MQTSRRVCGCSCASAQRSTRTVGFAPFRRTSTYRCVNESNRTASYVAGPTPPLSRNEDRYAAAKAQGYIEGGAQQQFLSDEEVDDLISDAAGFVSVLDELRPLDPASYNPFYEVWTRIAHIPPEERYRLLDELEPGSLRSLWRASMARYLLDESRSLELFAGASVWDDFPSQPGQVYKYEGRCERYDVSSGGVTLERLSSGNLSPRQLGGDAAAVPANPWLRPSVSGWELQTDRFKQLFFVPPEGCAECTARETAADVGNDGGDDDDEGLMMQLELAPPRIYSRLVLPLAGPLDRWWEPLYCRLRVQLTLTPLSRDAGADLQLLYPADPRAAAQDDGDDETNGGASEPAPGTGPEPTGRWGLLGQGCLPSPPAAGWLRWPEPEPEVYGVSPFSGGPRDFMRVAGPGVYVGCAYRQGPGPREYREENFVYFVIARRY